MNKENDKNSKLVTISISEEMEILRKCEGLAKELKTHQKKFIISTHTSIECAREIGRIASEAKECIKSLPTKAQRSNLDGYIKPTFEDWIKTCTGLSKDTIYAMMKLHKYFESNPTKFDDDVSWREALGILKKESLLIEGESDIIDVDAEEIEENTNGKSNAQERVQKEEFNKLRDKVNKLFEKFLKDFENSEYKEQITKCKALITDNSLQA